MAESFGDEFAIVEVTSDDPEPKKRMWLALAKPDQAVTLVLAAVPEGWTGVIVPAVVTDRQRRLFQKLHLQPGDVYELL